jgi:hypothetical protein
VRRNYFSHVARPQSLVPPTGRARGTQRGEEQKNLPARAAYRCAGANSFGAEYRVNSLCASVRGFFFFYAGIWIGRERSTRWRERGPVNLSCGGRALASKPSGGAGQHPLPWPTYLMKTQVKGPYPTSRPPFDPRQGSAEASAAAPGSTPAKRPGSVPGRRGCPFVDCWYHSVH